MKKKKVNIVKNKKLKIFLLISLLIITAGAGYLLYEFKFKEYDVADEEVEQIVEDPYTLEMPDGTTITLDDDGEVVDATETISKNLKAGSVGTTTTTGETSTTGKVEGTTSSGNSSTGTSTAATSGKDSTPTTGTGSNAGASDKTTVGTIKQKYVPALESLQTQADGRLNTLVGHAKTEYTTKKENGESVSYGYFYNKYSGAASGLEARTDAVFSGVIKAVEKDLVANGYDKSYAQSFIDDYNAKKKARRDSLLSKVVNR